MRKAVLFLPLLLMACSEPELTPEQQEAAEERAIAAVEAAQTIPPEPVTPEPILFADIERYDLFGAGCSFMPGGRPAEAPDGAGVLALTSKGGAYIKIESELHRLAPDVGSPELPLGTRGKYDGREFALILDIAAEEGAPSGMETIDFPARLVLRNARDQTVYAETGIAQCGS